MSDSKKDKDPSQTEDAAVEADKTADTAESSAAEEIAEDSAAEDTPAEEVPDAERPWNGDPPAIIAEDTARLCGRGARTAGSLEETIAADYLRSSMEGLDLEVILQRFSSPGSTAWVLAVHMGLGVVAAMLSGLSSTLAAIALIAILLSFVGECYFRLHWLSALMPSLRSQNVIGHYLPPKDPKQVVVLTSHMDSPRSGLLFSTGLARRLRTLGLATIPAASLLLLTAVILMEALGGGGFIIGLLFWIAVAGTLISGAFAANWGMGTPVEGASDASGMATVLEMARRVSKAKPRETEYYFVAFGGRHSMLSGSRHFVETFSSRLNPEQTIVINVDSVSAGELRLVGQEQSLCKQSYPDPLLWVAARRLAMKDKRFEGIKPAVAIILGDALFLAMARYHCVTLAGMRSDDMPFHGGLPLDTLERQTWQDADRSLDFIEALIKDMKP